LAVLVAVAPTFRIIVNRLKKPKDTADA